MNTNLKEFFYIRSMYKVCLSSEYSVSQTMLNVIYISITTKKNWLIHKLSKRVTVGNIIIYYSNYLAR